MTFQSDAYAIIMMGMDKKVFPFISTEAHVPRQRCLSKGEVDRKILPLLKMATLGMGLMNDINKIHRTLFNFRFEIILRNRMTGNIFVTGGAGANGCLGAIFCLLR